MLKGFTLILAVMATLFLAACDGADQGGIVIENVWGRPSPKSASNAAFYMDIRNSGQEDDSLVEASVGICGKTELHMSAIDENGVMSMRQVQAIDILDGETVKLEPGGLHIMCIDRQVELNLGDRFPITLLFAGVGEQTVEAEIQENN